MPYQNVTLGHDLKSPELQAQVKKIANSNSVKKCQENKNRQAKREKESKTNQEINEWVEMLTLIKKNSQK